MSQTVGAYLEAQYGEAQQSIQLELDWMESVLLSEPEICSECDGHAWVDLPDGSRQCAYCD